MVDLALRDVGANLGTAFDQPLVFQNGKRLPNGVAGHEEFGRQLTFRRQPIGIGAGMDLMSQHVGDAARAIGAGTPDRYGYSLWSHVVTVMRLAAIFTAPKAGRTGGSAYCAGSNSVSTS